MTTVTPAQPTFFWAPAKISPNCTKQHRKHWTFGLLGAKLKVKVYAFRLTSSHYSVRLMLAWMWNVQKHYCLKPWWLSGGKAEKVTKIKGFILSLHLWHIHRLGQEVGGHVTDEDRPVRFRYEVEFHAMHRLVAAVVNIGGRGVQGPAAGVWNSWREQQQNSYK